MIFGTYDFFVLKTNVAFHYSRQLPDCRSFFFGVSSAEILRLKPGDMWMFGVVYNPDTDMTWGRPWMLSNTISKKHANYKSIFVHLNIELTKSLARNHWLNSTYYHPTHGQWSPMVLSFRANNNPDTTGPAVQPQKPGGFSMDFLCSHLGNRPLRFFCVLKWKGLTFLECCTKGICVHYKFFRHKYKYIYITVAFFSYWELSICSLPETPETEEFETKQRVKHLKQAASPEKGWYPTSRRIENCQVENNLVGESTKEKGLPYTVYNRKVRIWVCYRVVFIPFPFPTTPEEP